MKKDTTSMMGGGIEARHKENLLIALHPSQHISTSITGKCYSTLKTTCRIDRLANAKQKNTPLQNKAELHCKLQQALLVSVAVCLCICLCVLTEARGQTRVSLIRHHQPFY